MQPRARRGIGTATRALLGTALLAGAVTGCIGTESPRPSLSPAVSPTLPTPSTLAVPTPSPSRPAPGPTEEVVAGRGDIRVTADTGSFVSSPVQGDCLLAGTTLPPDGDGPALGDDVTTYLALDNAVGPLDADLAPTRLAVTVDGSDGQARVDLVGAPATWQWWSGVVGRADLSDPVDDDGVTVATLSLAATLERDERGRVDVRAPQAPSPSPSPGTSPGTSASPSPGTRASPSPGTRASRGIGGLTVDPAIARPVPGDREGVPILQSAEPSTPVRRTPTPPTRPPTRPTPAAPSAPATPSVATDGSSSQTPAGTPAPPTSSTRPSTSPSPQPSTPPAPVASLELDLVVTCTLVR